LKQKAAVAVLTAFVLTSACGGGSSPTSAPPPVASTPVAGTPVVPTPTPGTVAPPVAASTCPYGKGSLDAQCGRQPSQYVADIDRAIADVLKARPDIFDMRDEPTPGNYRVTKVADYFTAVVQRLVAAGFCAQADGVQTVQVKKSADFSEKYAILTSDSYMRKGEGSYRDSCRPAIFPVDDVDYIDAIRVHFFGITCKDRTAPDNALKLLPLGCVGYVSATPKDKANKDVPSEIHGSEIAWEILQGDGENLAKVSDYPGQSFNKVVDPINTGYLTLCATVKGIRGCFGFDIIP
jgi:hypothetical protein